MRTRSLLPVLALGGAALIVSALPAPAQQGAADGADLVRAEVNKVLLVDNHPVVLLSDAEEKRHLLVFIDHFMAQAIQMGLMGLTIERPLTHDLIPILLHRLGAEVSRVAITDLRENTYFAFISLQNNGSSQQIDARPSDALAIAVRTKAPIFVNPELMSEEMFPDEVVPKEGQPMPAPEQPQHGA